MNAVACLSLFASIARRAKDLVKAHGSSHLLPLQQFAFMESSSITVLARRGDASQIGELVEALLDPKKEDDKVFSAEFCLHWATEAKSAPTTASMDGPVPWIRFMDNDQLIALLGACLRTPSQRERVLDGVLCELNGRQLDRVAVQTLHALLPDLLRLAHHSASDHLHGLILKVIAQDLPLGHDGLYGSSPSFNAEAEHVWVQRGLASRGQAVASNTLASIALSIRTAKVAAAIVYRFPSLRADVFNQLSAQQPSEDFVHVLHALLDVARTSAGMDVTPLFSWSKKLVSATFKLSTPLETRRTAARCLEIMADLWVDKRAALCTRIVEHIAKHSGLLVDSSTLDLLERLVTRWPKDFEELASAVVNHQLQALVRHFVEVKEDTTLDSIPTNTLSAFPLVPLSLRADPIRSHACKAR